ncbi:hypothetical protein BSLG_007317 [Batrachochytrium salamandrivorans]|nr:hypothetical protein BSLG_007317 [Batrachochytrium salamandrivorans]
MAAVVHSTATTKSIAANTDRALITPSLKKSGAVSAASGASAASAGGVSAAATSKNAKKIAQRRESRKRKRKTQTVIAALKQLPTANVDDISDTEVLDSEEEELVNLVFSGDGIGAVSKALNASHSKQTFMATSAAGTSSHELSADPRLTKKDDGEEDEELGDTLGFSIDLTGTVLNNALDEKQSGAGTASRGVLATPSAWVDEDDDSLMVDVHRTKRLRKLRDNFDETTVAGADYEQRLRNQYERLFPKPKWAELPVSRSKADSDKDSGVEDEDMDEDDGHDGKDISDTKDLGHSMLLRLLRSTESIVDVNRKALLSADKLDVMRLKDANQLAYSQAVVQSLQFHPYAPVLLTCGFDKTLRLFQVDGKLNPKIQSIYIKDMPIHKAHFTADGQRIILTGRRKWFYVYDLESGTTSKIWGVRGRKDKSFERSIISPCGRYIGFLCRDGNLAMISSKTMQWAADIKMNGHIQSAMFSKSGDTLYTFGGDSEVYEWDMASRECTNRFTDHGCIRPTTIAVSDDGQYIATGSSSGVVNVYLAKETRGVLGASHQPVPIKAFMNLTTAITTLVFHPDSKLLLMASHTIKDALRIVHLPSMHVVKNWPTASTPLGYVSTAAFSPRGGYMSVGNAKGRALLFKLGAYEA